MVSKASEDLPDPDTPVTTVRVLWSTVTSMFLRLWTLRQRATMLSVDISTQETTRLPPENEPPLSKSCQKELASLRNLSIIRQEPPSVWRARLEGTVRRVKVSAKKMPRSVIP